MLRSSNPALSQLETFERPTAYGNLEKADAMPRTMTVQGVVNLSFVLLGLCAATAVAAWSLISAGTVPAGPVMIGGALGGFAIAIVTCFKPNIARFTAIPYALLEGAFLGAVSLVVAQNLDAQLAEAGVGTNVVFQAIVLTFGVFGAMLIAYTTRVIRVGSMFRKAMVIAIGGYLLFFIISLVMSFFFKQGALISMFDFNNGSPISIGFSLLVVGLASFSLLLDFDRIERGAQAGLPKHMEWFCAFSLLVTLVWLYFEILRLLSKLRSNN